jgi:hypothetical protein
MRAGALAASTNLFSHFFTMSSLGYLCLTYNPLLI